MPYLTFDFLIIFASSFERRSKQIVKPQKKNPPKKKAPNKKGETAACGSACLRAAAPPSSLASFLSSFGGCAASFSCPLRASLSSCGRLRRPTPSASPPLLRRLRRLTLPRALVGGWRRPPLLSLFALYQTINNPLTPSQVINFFSFAIIALTLKD
ncbi:MAG: hypothetical protein K6A67_11670 [Bacteroidales bacterium]|nr:hypothetical protein [Bacteroidales bacterium]